MQTRTYKNGTTVHVVRWRVNGARHFRQFVNRQEAEAFEASVRLTRANGGTPPADPGATVADLVALYADALARDVEAGERSRHTAAAHAGQLSRHILPRLGGTRLVRLTPAAVAGWRDDLRRDGVGLPTVRRAMAVLSAACTFGAERGMLSANPCRDVRGVRAPRKARPVALGAAELGRLADALPAGRDRTLALVLALAGVRPGEALALRWSDVGERTVSVTKSLAFGEEKATKTRRDRSVPVSPELRLALDAWRAEQGNPFPAQLVFPRRDRGPWRDTDWRNWRRRVFVPAAERAELPIRRPYDLRHTAASRWLLEEHDVLVAQWMGHSLSVLHDTYSHEVAEASARQA